MKKILIVDDDQDFRASMSALLKPKGYDINEEGNKTDALKSIQLEKPDIILLDIDMTTDKEGLELAVELQKSPDFKKIPVIIISGLEIIRANIEIARLARKMRKDPDFKAMEILLLKGEDEQTAMDFRSSLTGDSVYLPVFDFVRKPVNLEKLYNIIKKI